jgi:hypothetical protein
VLCTLLVVGATVFPSAAAATPSYEGGASAGWGYQEGDLLAANPGTWTSTTGIGYSYAWFNENSVRLGTGPTYTVGGSDVGHQIYAAITATDDTPPSLTVNTPTVGPMHYRPPVNTEKPTVTGVFQQGSTLVATAGKWMSGGASTAPIEIGYAWYRGCSIGPRPDCSNSGYVGRTSSLVRSSADLGRWISLSITASYPDGVDGQASGSVWLGNLGPVIASSVKAGDTLSGTAQWTVTAPGAQTVAFSAGGAFPVVEGVDGSGAATIALDTTTLPNGSNNLAVTVTWTDGPTTTQLGSVTVANTAVIPPPVVVKPVIARPVITPKQALAGSRLVLTFAVTRSDNRQPLTRGKMKCEPWINGEVIRHAASFANAKARLAFTVPRTARHKLLKVRLTIKLGDQSTTRTATFLVR